MTNLHSPYTVSPDILVYLDMDELNKRLLMLPGFSPFSKEQILAYFNDPDTFSLAFNKEAGKGILYGLQLAMWRQDMFNQLPKQDRCSIILQKLHAQGLQASIQQFLGSTCTLADLLQDAFDIGMGHSVFKLDCSPLKSIVVKPTTTTHAVFFNQLLQFFDYPTIRLADTKLSSGTWQLADFYEGQTLSTYLQSQKPSEGIIAQLAFHACLSDVFGRGDRHLENYLVVDDQLYALDISYMFWPKNEIWVNRYISGGQSECTILAHYPQFETLYWTTYKQVFAAIKSKQEAAFSLLDTFYKGSEANTYCHYVQSRLDDNNYYSNRNAQAAKALQVYKHRLVYKTRLQKLVEQGAVIKHPILMMYYYANKDRLTAFFLMELFHPDVFDYI